MLTLLQPSTKLTEKETSVLAFFVKKYHDLVQVPEPYRTNALFSTEVRKECMIELKMKSSQLNFIISTLKKKNMILTKANVNTLNSFLTKLTPDTTKITYELIYI